MAEINYTMENINKKSIEGILLLVAIDKLRKALAKLGKVSDMPKHRVLAWLIEARNKEIEWLITAYNKEA